MLRRRRRCAARGPRRRRPDSRRQAPSRDTTRRRASEQRTLPPGSSAVSRCHVSRRRTARAATTRSRCTRRAAAWTIHSTRPMRSRRPAPAACPRRARGEHGGRRARRRRAPRSQRPTSLCGASRRPRRRQRRASAPRPRQATPSAGAAAAGCSWRTGAEHPPRPLAGAVVVGTARSRASRIPRPPTRLRTRRRSTRRTEQIARPPRLRASSSLDHRSSASSPRRSPK